MAKESLSEAVARAALMGLAGFGFNGGGSGWGGSGGEGRSRGPGEGGVGDDGYPHPLHTVKVNWVPGPPRYNLGIKRHIAELAARMQTKEEHERALNQFIRPGQTPLERHQAIVKGAEAEAKLESYWDDRKPRRNFSPSSSAVKAIRITPDNRVQVMWGGGKEKWYTYKQHPTPYDASLAARRLLTAGSIGMAVMPGKGFFSKEENDDSMRPAGSRRKR